MRRRASTEDITPWWENRLCRGGRRRPTKLLSRPQSVLEMTVLVESRPSQTAQEKKLRLRKCMQGLQNAGILMRSGGAFKGTEPGVPSVRRATFVVLPITGLGRGGAGRGGAGW